MFFFVAADAAYVFGEANIACIFAAHEAASAYTFTAQALLVILLYIGSTISCLIGFALSSAMSDLFVAPPRFRLQDYCCLAEYLTNSAWSFLLDSNNHGTAKTNLVFDLAMSLGLRYASETTMGHITSLHLIATEGHQRAMAMEPAMKLECCKTIKHLFKRRLELKLQNGQVIQLQRLPTPHELCSQQPALWQQLFANEQPSSQPPISTLSIQSLASSIPLRCSNSSTKLSMQSSQASSTWPFGASPQQLQALMAGMMNGGVPPWQHPRRDPEIPIIYRATSRSQLLDALPEEHSSLPLAVLDRGVASTGQNTRLEQDVKRDDEVSNPALPVKPKPIAEVTDSLIEAMNLAKAEKDEKKKKKAKKASGNKVKKASTKKDVARGSDEAAKVSSKSSNSKEEVKKEVCKKPKTNTKPAPVKHKWNKTPPKDLILKFKSGCGRCRYAVGCTPSCWKQRGF